MKTYKLPAWFQDYNFKHVQGSTKEQEVPVKDTGSIEAVGFKKN